jgi:hypothetical protein
MMSEKTSFPEWPYVSITQNVYHPYTENGKWYVIPGREVTFLHFVYLCKVPDEEAMLLKLTHGG